MHSSGFLLHRGLGKIEHSGETGKPELAAKAWEGSSLHQHLFCARVGIGYDLILKTTGALSNSSPFYPEENSDVKNLF